MPERQLNGLSRRERQIMDFLYERERASVAEVMAGISEPPSYSAVRALLNTLEQKGHVTHLENGRAYVYQPRLKKDSARKGALSHLVKTFFDGSTEKAMAALLDLKGERLSKAELDSVARLVEQARQEGR